MENKFIVIEGRDGTGKSSVAIELTRIISTTSKNGAVYYKTPAKPFLNLKKEIEQTGDWNLIYHLFLTGTLYSSWEIGQLLKHSHVICDRYYYTTIAYHRCQGVNIPNEAANMFLQPDYCFCLDATEDEIKERLQQREYVGTHDFNFELQNRAFAELKKFPMEIINTSQTPIPEVVNKILNKIVL